PEFEITNRSRNLGAAVDRDFFARDRVDSDLTAEEQQIAAVPAQGEVEDTGIFQEELPFLRKKELVWREIKLLRVHVSIGEIGIRSEVCHQVRAQPQLHIDTAGMECTGSWCQSGSR